MADWLGVAGPCARSGFPSPGRCHAHSHGVFCTNPTLRQRSLLLLRWLILGLYRVEQVFFQTGVDTVDHFADLGFFQRLGAYLAEDQTFGAGIIPLVKKAWRYVDGLMLLEMQLFTVFQSPHGALALNHEQCVVRAGMTVQFIVDAGFVAVERDMEPVGLRRARIVAACRPAPLRLFFDIDDGNLFDFRHDSPPKCYLPMNLQDVRVRTQVACNSLTDFCSNRKVV